MKLPKVNKVKLAYVLIGVLFVGMFVLMEVITYRETTQWITEMATHYYNGRDNQSFLVQSR